MGSRPLSPLRRQKLRKRREFLAVQGGGRRLSGRHYLFFVRPRSDLVASHMALPTRFGITVTRKVGNAVTRNRIKRVVREGFRVLASAFPLNHDLVVVAKPTAVGDGLAAVTAELRELLARLGKPVPSGGERAAR